MRRITILAAIMVLALTRNGACGWQGPLEVLSGTWGKEEMQFGIERGEVSVWGPLLTAVLGDGSIIISDEINEQEKVYGQDGALVRIIPWQIKSEGTTTINPDYNRYRYAEIVGYTAEGNIWLGDRPYRLKSPDGLIMQDVRNAPAELGVFRRERDRRGKETLSLVYPDRTYSLEDREYPKRIRDKHGSLHLQEDRTISRYGSCGNVIAQLVVPEFEAGNVVFGPPLIGPEGEVYAGKRTLKGYSVVKWGWKDEPDGKGGPEAPTALMTTNTSLGLFITWKPSAHDPGCVTGYEISRAASPGGPYSVIETVEKGVLKYNDRTIEAGKPQYYKVRAVAGNEFSKYSDIVEGKR